MLHSDNDSSSNPISNLSKLALEEGKGQSEDEQLTKRNLYGGAMAISIPSKWRDVSDVRQVPDHQEVYQDCTFVTNNHEQEVVQDGYAGTGGCLVIEILERQDEVNDEEAPHFFFHDLADANQKEENGVGTDSTRNDGATATSSSPSIEYSNIWTVGTEGNGGKGEEGKDKQENGENKNLMPKLSSRVKACSCVGFQSISPLRNQAEVEVGKASEIRVELCVVRLEAVQTDLLISLSMPIFSGETNMGGLSNRKKKKRGQGHSELFKLILADFEVADWSLFA